MRLPRLSPESGLSGLLTTSFIAVACMSKVAQASLGSVGNLTTGDKYQASINNPPRLQWSYNFGYCGEVSLISAGLRYGQYCSQYEARAIASNNTPQYKSDSQLLLGVNALWAASQMSLQAEEYDNSGGPDSQGYLTWVKNGILENSSVIMGIYTNEYLFYDNKNAKAGQPDYDHIVPVIGLSSNYPLSPTMYHANDTIVFSDNGLWAPHNNPTYIWQYQDASFQAARQQANAPNGAVYSLADNYVNYGMIVSGIIDNDGETVPVSLATNVNSETPQIQKGSNNAPQPENIVLTITVASLKPGSQYNLYRYSSFASVPASSFNAKRSQASQSWQISATSTSYTTTQTILSNEVSVYRAVPISAP